MDECVVLNGNFFLVSFGFKRNFFADSLKDGEKERKRVRVRDRPKRKKRKIKSMESAVGTAKDLSKNITKLT